jgi:hypothetical protein
VTQEIEQSRITALGPLLELVQLDAFLAEQRRRDAKPTWTDAEPNPGERTLFAYVSSGVM